MGADRAWVPRLWLSGFALGLLLTYGINLMETPAPETVEQLLTSGRLSFDRAPLPATAPYPMGRDGRYYSIHELGTVFLSLPAGVPALWVSRAAGVPFKRALEFGNAVLSAALFGVLLVALLWDSAPDRAVLRRRAAVLLALLMASQYLVFAGFAADVSVSAVLLVLMCVAWRATARGGLMACAVCGLLGGALVFTKISNTFVPLTALGLLMMERGRPARDRIARPAAFALGATPFFAVAAWWNDIRMGAPWRTPFPRCHEWELGFAAEGLASSFIAPAKGLLVFTPALLLLPFALRAALREPAYRREALLVSVSFLLTLLRLAPTDCWHSAAGWGIRYYVPWIPALVLILARGVFWREAGSRAAAAGRAALVAAGLLINVSGVVTNFHYRRHLCGTHPWAFPGSALCAVPALPQNLARSVGVPIPDQVLARASPEYVFVSNRLPMWWYSARTIGLPAWASWSIGLGLLALSIAAWRSAFAPDPAASRARLPAVPAVIPEGDA